MKYDNQRNMTLFTDREYVLLAIAGAMGKDKLIYKDRLEFVQDNLANMWNMIDQADEPYQLRKALHALEDADKGIPSGFCMGMDSTASGVQVFSLLSGCIKSAIAVNLTGDGLRHDLYTDIGDVLNMPLERQILKDNIMTHFYQSIKLQKETFGNDIGRFNMAMSEVLPGASEILELCKQIQGTVKDGTINVKTPDGFDCLLRQRVKKDYKIEAKIPIASAANIYFTQRRTEFGVKRDEYGRLSARDVGANLAHICDGTMARVSITRASHAGIGAYHVHDKFFTLPCNMNKFRWMFREVLAELAESNYMQDFTRQVTGIKSFTYTKHSNDLPNEVRKSDYFLT